MTTTTIKYHVATKVEDTARHFALKWAKEDGYRNPTILRVYRKPNSVVVELAVEDPGA